VPVKKSMDPPTRAYRITWWLVRFLVPAFGGVTVIGAENIPKEGPVILACNHAAHMDPPYLSQIMDRQLHMMAKEELFQVPVLGRYIRALAAFPVKRGTADRAALREATLRLKQGHVLGIFPEGTRSPDGALGTAEKGFALLARQTGAPVVPVALCGTNQILPKSAKWPRRHHVHVKIGQPFTAQEILAAHPGEKDALMVIGRETMAAIAALLRMDEISKNNVGKIAQIP
jgi:1-acyl-sn-glycerol-3-phosphate acyltransferase